MWQLCPLIMKRLHAHDRKTQDVSPDNTYLSLLPSADIVLLQCFCFASGLALDKSLKLFWWASFDAFARTPQLKWICLYHLLQTLQSLKMRLCRNIISNDPPHLLNALIIKKTKISMQFKTKLGIHSLGLERVNCL